MQEERVDSGGDLVSGPSAFMQENPQLFGINGDVIDVSSYVPWTTPEARFENIIPA